MLVPGKSPVDLQPEILKEDECKFTIAGDVETQIVPNPPYPSRGLHGVTLRNTVMLIFTAQSTVR
jgi:hypothetical protein